MQSTEVAVVTGAGGMRSIGRAVAVRLAQDGYDVVISDFQRPDDRVADDERAANWGGLASVAQEIAQLGRRALPVVCDLTSASDIEHLIGQAVAEFGRLDVLVNTARAFTYPNKSKPSTCPSKHGTTSTPSMCEGQCWRAVARPVR